MSIAQTIVNGISDLICNHLNLMEHERTSPGANPDLMDDTIKFHCAQAHDLRQLRERFEDIAARVAP